MLKCAAKRSTLLIAPQLGKKLIITLVYSYIKVYVSFSIKGKMIFLHITVLGRQVFFRQCIYIGFIIFVFSTVEYWFTAFVSQCLDTNLLILEIVRLHVACQCCVLFK